MIRLVFLETTRHCLSIDGTIISRKQTIKTLFLASVRVRPHLTVKKTNELNEKKVRNSLDLISIMCELKNKF